ncbi:MAG TPA: hypothetical protein PLS60_04560 [Arenimonas sp.]|nr:hypothetical protein [Arenimonas sp.]HPO23182.1 hypothetical protein [Arenimonas sp.]
MNKFLCRALLVLVCFSAYQTARADEASYIVLYEERKMDVENSYPMAYKVVFSDIVYFPSDNFNGMSDEARDFFNDASEDGTDCPGVCLTASSSDRSYGYISGASVEEVVEQVKLYVCPLDEDSGEQIGGYCVDRGAYEIKSGVAGRKYFSWSPEVEEIDLEGEL